MKFSMWSFLRSVLSIGGAIETDTTKSGRGHEEHSIRLDAQAKEYEQRLMKEILKNDLPVIVCLCGSTRFYEAFQKANYEETMAGKIVLSVGHYPNSDGKHGEVIGCTPEQKVELDKLHKKKIDLADEVLVLNVGGYIGESTRGEINHATETGKPIRYLEPL